MVEQMLDEKYIVSTEDDLRALYPGISPLAKSKCIDALDEHSVEFIKRSPFVCLGTQGRDGRADVSPRGDHAGFVQILDATTLAIPDRPGNNRLDSIANIVENPAVGLLFLIPGYDETLRVNGNAKLTNDPALLEKMTVRGKLPRLAIVVEISEIFLHCAKAFRRSKLWDQKSHQDRSEMPSLAKMILDQTTGAPEDAAEQQKIDDRLEESYKKSMY